jgi:diguanylate cyclase (GGDEF)-like protein/PAS domain S-box-containing protein
MRIWNWQKDEAPLGPAVPKALGGLARGRRRVRPISRESTLLAGELLYRTLFEEVPIGLYITTADGTIINVNAELARILEYPDRQMLLGSSVSEIYADPHEGQRVVVALEQSGAVHRSEVALRTRSGAIILALDTRRVVRDERGTILYCEGSMQDVTEARRLEEQLRHMARHDPLTGVYNRHALNEILPNEIARSCRYRHPIGVLMVDVDQFKEFNDRFGHAAGDEVLKDIAALITRCVRDSDVVVRYGGDEFLVLLVETNGEAVRVKERIEREMAETFGAAQYGAPITVAIGAAHWSPETGESVDDLLSQADKAMYAEKNGGHPR